MNTEKTIVINVPYKDLYAEDENCSLAKLNPRDPVGVTFNITRREYRAIRRIQRLLARHRLNLGRAVTCSSVNLSWTVNDDVNFTADCCDYKPRGTMLEVDDDMVELCLYNRAISATCVRANVTELLEAAFKPRRQANPKPQPAA